MTYYFENWVPPPTYYEYMKKRERMTGFPSPAEDYQKSRLSIDELIIQHPAATFFIRMQGEAMKSVGIHHNDIMVVDRSIFPPKHGDVVIAVVDNEYHARYFEKEGNAVWLRAANEHFSSIRVSGEMDLVIWGVVTVVLHFV